MVDPLVLGVLSCAIALVGLKYQRGVPRVVVALFASALFAATAWAVHAAYPTLALWCVIVGALGAIGMLMVPEIVDAVSRLIVRWQRARATRRLTDEATFGAPPRIPARVYLQGAPPRKYGDYAVVRVDPWVEPIPLRRLEVHMAVPWVSCTEEWFDLDGAARRGDKDERAWDRAAVVRILRVDDTPILACNLRASGAVFAFDFDGRDDKGEPTWGPPDTLATEREYQSDRWHKLVIERTENGSVIRFGPDGNRQHQGTIPWPSVVRVALVAHSSTTTPRAWFSTPLVELQSHSDH